VPQKKRGCFPQKDDHSLLQGILGMILALIWRVRQKSRPGFVIRIAQMSPLVPPIASGPGCNPLNRDTGHSDKSATI
jgi:hypothetical protein